MLFVKRNATNSEIIAMTNYRYEVKSLRQTSEKFGPCEVCDEHVSEVHYQSEWRKYKPDSWTAHGCTNRFGHLECLVAQQRT